MTNSRTRSISMVVLTLISVGLATACAHVGKDQYDTEMESLRRIIEEGDQANQRSMAALEERTDEQMDELAARLDGLEEGLSELRGDFNVTVERLGDAIRFAMPVHFAFDQATLRTEDRPVLDRLSGVVKEFYPEALLTVEGFTDRAGSAEYNRALGMRRAQAVRTYLVASGLPESHLRAVSYGEDPARLVKPDQAGPDRGAENRRVAVVIEHLGTTTAVTSTVTSGTP